MPRHAGRLALRNLSAFAILAGAMGAAGAQALKAPDDAAINTDQAIQALKDEVVQFNSDAEAAEDEFLYPPHSRLVVYLTNKVPGFLLSQVVLTVDDQKPVTVSYDDDASLAMNVDNAMQRLLRANIARGGHRLTVNFQGHLGTDPKKVGEPATGHYEALFDKSTDPAELELVIIKGARKNAPTMQLKEWRMEE
jgi:hypothetical protein